jgi:transposase
VVRKSEDTKPESEKVLCLCCGAEMKPEKTLEKSTLFRCTGCGLSDTRMNC